MLTGSTLSTYTNYRNSYSEEMMRVYLKLLDTDHRFAVDIPEGYRHVRSGVLLPGDRYLNRVLYVTEGIVEWIPVEAKHLGKSRHRPNCGAEWYACLIRREMLG